ncbi:hypothetical protein BVC80_9083g14 [Macleaya cordata]|uniref:Uncharacterized protein n=1 Tax=Macleaya cordata TaxID=56857 RepID=A0A200PR83_MACCD|nr:hypothetical protein BVC80_9083g14 [Macleaya cordata]
MVSSSCLLFTNSVSHLSPITITVSEKNTNSQKNLNICFSKRQPKSPLTSNSPSSSSQLLGLQKLVPLAASVAILFWSNPVNAGILSGFSGLESMPGPQLPQIDFLNRFNGTSKRFKTSTAYAEPSGVLEIVRQTV